MGGIESVPHPGTTALKTTDAVAKAAPGRMKRDDRMGVRIGPPYVCDIRGSRGLPRTHLGKVVGTFSGRANARLARSSRGEERYTKRAMLDLAFARFLTHLHELAGEPVPGADGRTEADGIR